MKRDLWEAKHKSVCGTVMKKKTFALDGIKVRGWECPKCDESVLHPHDAQRVFVLNKLKRGIPVKVGELGNSLIMRIPKEIAEFYNLSKGEAVMFKAEGPKTMEIEV